VSVAFIKLIAAEAFWPQSALGRRKGVRGTSKLSKASSKLKVFSNPIKGA
jgi:hypothetical protein